jgi:DNA-binding CsgD family transcriptional regulator
MKSRWKQSPSKGMRSTRAVRLLLVCREDEFDQVVIRRILDASQPWIASRSANLLDALERLQSELTDFVLMGHNFRSAELELFIAEARRNGFGGLILQATSAEGTILALPGNTSQSTSESGKDSFSSTGRSAGSGSDHSLSFTPRERAVLAAVCNGWTNQEVARRLECSEGTVKAILQQLFRKIGVRKRAQIVRLALEKGLIDADGSLNHSSIRVTGLLPVRLAKQKEEAPISIGHFVLDIAMHKVWVRGVEIHLTPKELWLLAFFAAHPGELMESHALCEAFWRNPTSKRDALRVLVAALRAKIEISETPRYLVTERSYGYRFNPLPPPAPTGGNNASPS